MSHFENDARFVARAAQASPEAFANVAVFVLLTIQQAFYLMRPMVESVAQRGEESPYLWGMKTPGFRYIAEHKASLHGGILEYRSGGIDFDSLVCRFMAIPGLGIVKASFLAQMTVNEGACIDRHNLKMLGLGVDAFKTPKTLKPAMVLRKVAQYNAIWRDIGDSAHWWNLWCEHVASLYPARFANGAEVSALHRLAVEGFFH